jgi:4-amino-4-deoxy-L-arabinose transferase-like glycosyltransferase
MNSAVPKHIRPQPLLARWAVWLPALIGLVTALVYGWVWGGLHPVPAIIDETAYLLQARIFAGGHWTAPARPLPEFFEQLYVFVTPFLAAKYPPGHPMLLTLGELVGSPALIVLLLNAVSGALVFRLVAHRWGLLTGFLTWLIWLLAPINLTYRPSYLSNVTTAALWLVAWWALEQWWESGRRGWLLALAVSVAWCAITRPLTGLVLVVPIGIVVLRRVSQRGMWKDLGLAMVLGALVLAVLPLANRQTTGRWLEMPWTTYARLYTPYDHLGFGFDSTPPLKPPDAEFKRLAALRRAVAERHTMAALPTIAYDRMREILRGALGSGPVALLPWALVGLFFLNKRAGFAFICSLLLIVVHLAYAHDSRWTPYYLETIPILAFLAALGLTRLATLVRHPRLKLFVGAATAGFFVLWLVGALSTLPRARSMSRMVHAPYTEFRSRLERIADSKAIVFVRKPPRHTLGQSLVINAPDLHRARIWIVHDLGPENARLLALVPDRVPYLYDEERRRLTPLALADGLPRPQRKR